MSPVNPSNVPNAVSARGPLAPHPALPSATSATSAQGDNTKSSAKRPRPFDPPPTLSGTQEGNPRAQAKAPDSMKQPPRQSSKRPRIYDQMPSQAGLGSVAATSHISAPVQSATQAVEDPFPMDEGWESLELFDEYVNSLSEDSWAHEAQLARATASNGLATPGLPEAQAVLPGAAITQVEDSKPSAKRRGPLGRSSAESIKLSHVSSQRSSQGLPGPVAERAHSRISGPAAARPKETPLHLDQGRGVQESLAPDAKRLSGAAGRTSAKGVGLSREVQRAQIIQAISQCALDISGLASGIDAALMARAQTSHVSVTMNQVRGAIKSVASFAEKQAHIARGNQASHEALQNALTKSAGVKNALQTAVSNAFSDQRVIQIQHEVARAFGQGEQSLAQAAASITANAARPMLSYAGNHKAILVSAAAAVAVFHTALNEAAYLSPSSEAGVKRAIRSGLGKTAEGRVVLKFIDKARDEYRLAESTAARKQQMVQEIAKHVSVVSRCASVVQTAERSGDEQAFSVAVSQAVIRASNVVTQFVKTQARIAENEQVTLGELEDARRKCEAGKGVMRLIESYVFSEEVLPLLRREISDPVRYGHQSPAQAAAAIAMKGAGDVLVHPDIDEVVRAATAAVASVVVFARQEVNRVSPLTKAENEHAIQQALQATEGGLAVMSFISALRPPHLPTWPA